ncbi:hypothetical protein FCULG_00012792 [Fusarium culmorum]|uniref:Uncharacterized protein n=1 Tax=Fusarium culmorum TaxID=5516 RepID=A0A2T4GIW6_FUSCU|nr:hypothetical protein FCULG_00012792 [Fusarium culmorum]
MEPPDPLQPPSRLEARLASRKKSRENRRKIEDRCRQALVSHVYQETGVRVQPKRLRLGTSNSLGYKWTVHDPLFQPIFLKRLSNMTMDEFWKLYRGVGSAFIAVRADDDSSGASTSFATTLSRTISPAVRTPTPVPTPTVCAESAETESADEVLPLDPSPDGEAKSEGQSQGVEYDLLTLGRHMMAEEADLQWQNQVLSQQLRECTSQLDVAVEKVARSESILLKIYLATCEICPMIENLQDETCGALNQDSSTWQQFNNLERDGQ